jgi:hypothetical protein
MVNGTKHLRPIFSIVTGTSSGYLPLLFSYSVYIGCVVLQGCPTRGGWFEKPKNRLFGKIRLFGHVRVK